MHIITDGFEISAGAAIDDQRLVAPAEEVAKLLVPPIETAGIGSQQPLHAGDQIRAGCFDDQVKMVGHQAPGMDLLAGFFTRLVQRLYKRPEVLLLLEDGVTPIPSAHDVVNSPGILNAQFSRHDPMVTVLVLLSIL